MRASQLIAVGGVAALAACSIERVTFRRGCTGDCFESVAYLKASNTGPEHQFGRAIALSSDGSTLAVGAIGESSAATGIGGNQDDRSAAGAGAVYVFTWSGATWTQQAYVKASNTGVSDGFGQSVALSADGSTLAVGAPLEDSAAIGIGGNQDDDSAVLSGAVYVFTRTGATWRQEAYVKPFNTGANDLFGWSMALSADGSTLAVGAISEDSAASGIDGDPADDSAMDSGAVYVFARTGAEWSQRAYVKASNPGARDHFGSSVTLSADGSILAVGASSEDSAATGVDGDQAGDAAMDSGAVYVFQRSGTRWGQSAYLKSSNAGSGDAFGTSATLSADGSTLAVGAVGESSAGGNQGDDSAASSGAVYVFTHSTTTWHQQAYLKAFAPVAHGNFGAGVALSAHGVFLAVGATGAEGNQADDPAAGAGAVDTFLGGGVTWNQQAHIEAPTPETDDWFGFGVALSEDGSTLAVGAVLEDSAALGIGGSEADNSAKDSGAVYVFR
jgi:hypothetical protein